MQSFVIFIQKNFIKKRGSFYPLKRNDATNAKRYGGDEP